MLFKFIYSLFFCSFLVVGDSFIPQGKWIIKNMESPYFMVDSKEIITISDNSVIVLKTKDWCINENQTVSFELTNFELIKRPRDWYNVKKYFRFINIYNKIRSNGLHIFVSILHNQEANISYSFDNQEYNLYLTKID